VVEHDFFWWSSSALWRNAGGRVVRSGARIETPMPRLGRGLLVHSGVLWSAVNSWRLVFLGRVFDV
jgi:hypothetical protein